MNKIAEYLNQHTAGNIFDKLSIREAYAFDVSILKEVPRFVAIPEDTQDIRKILRFSDRLAERNFRLPITVRGGGHDKTGAAVGGGMLIDMRKMNAIEEIDVRGRLVRVQAGVTIGELNMALAMHDLTIPVKVDPTHTIGGLIAGCTTDDYSGKYGGIYNYVDRVEFITASGDVIQTGVLSRRQLRRKQEQDNFEGQVYRELVSCLDDNAKLVDKIAERPFDAAGYATASLMEEGRNFDLLPLLFASQGTLGVMTEVILRCEVLPPEPLHLLATFNSMRSAYEFMKFARTLEPLLINFYDTRIMQAAEAHGKKPVLLTEELKDGYTVLVGFNDAPRKARHKLKKCVKNLPETTYVVTQDDENALDFADIDNAMQSYLNDDVVGERTALVDDVDIPDAHLINFTGALREFEAKVRQPLPLFGSFSARNYSVRPELNLDSVAGRQMALQFLRDYAQLVLEHHGNFSGGGPEGRVKALVVTLPDAEMQLYKQIKLIFDRNKIMNPDVKTGANPRATVKHLRATTAQKIVTE